ncbi:C25 family cysteine peptidase [Thiolapillus brandeum]|uniref:Gingipain domain-containing protein n=1 Tax=Thiolapillus brandeum TaxID=1076588 RepID=A0A7U6GHF7_9GAMM|nr:C25 family cysteine peptidase [Thiolapillus brandeum]BAO43700.1 hypothetical protein TBH_C0763 [Thiolapillus brandeum]
MLKIQKKLSDISIAPGRSLCCAIGLLMILLAGVPTAAVAAGDILWSTEVTTTPINTPAPATDNFVQDGVSVSIDYIFPDAPNPASYPTNYFETNPGTLGAEAGILLLGMDAVAGASGGNTECTRLRFHFSPAVSDLRFPLLDADYGSWRDMALVRATYNGVQVPGTGTIVDPSPTVQAGTPAGVTQYTCADIQNEFGSGLCFTGHTDNASATETRGNVDLAFTGFVDQLEISYCESDNPDNNGQILGVGDMFWGDNAADNSKDYGDAPASYGDAAHDVSDLSYLETVTVDNVDEAWQTVALRNTYTNPVIACTYNLPSTADAPAVVRIRNASATSFELRAQNPGDGSAVTPSNVNCLVAEQGLHTLPDGRIFEAHRVASGIVDHATSTWTGQTAVVNGTYTNPVVLGQVMTFNDVRWSAFWSYDCSSRQDPPAAGAGNICIGKHVGEDPDITRASEDLGYFIIEAGTGSFGGISYEAALGGDTVLGVDNAPPYSYALSQTFDFAVASQAAMDGNNGGWAQLFGASPVGATLDLVIDEDQIGDAERWHTSEQVGYWAFTKSQFNTPYIGALQGDTEAGTQSTADADGDDNNGVDDEEGVAFRSPAGGDRAEVYADVAVVNDSGGDAYICAWLDRWTDGGGTAVIDGSFDAADIADTPAQACQTVADNGGVATTVTFHWTGMPNVSGFTYARFRTCTNPSDCSSPATVAGDGEVEDYRIDFDFTPTSAVVDGFRVSWRRVGDLKREEPGLSAALSDLDDATSVAVVSWETLQEHGTLGFQVERRQDSGDWQAVDAGRFLPGLITAPLGGEYLLLDDGVKAGEHWTYRLTEKEVWGSERHYGPWEVTVGDARQTLESAARLEQSEARENWHPWRELMPGYMGRARESAPPSERTTDSQALSEPVTSGAATRLRLRTHEEGLHRVDLASLAALLTVPEDQLVTQLLSGEWGLYRGGRLLSYFYAPGEQALYFAGEPYRNIDTVENVYQLRPGAGHAMSLLMSTEEMAPVEPGSFRDSLHFEEENWLLTYVHQDENADYGYWDYIYTLNKPTADLHIQVPGPAASAVSSGRLRVTLRGQSDLVPGSDHRARVYLNDQPLAGEVEWNGNEQAVLNVSFDQAQLLSGNTLGDMLDVKITVEGEAANGAEYSLFFIESVDIDYERRYQAHGGNLWMHGAAPGVVTVTGFDSQNIRVIENPLATEPVWYSSPSVTPDGNGGWQVSFMSHGGDYLLSSNPMTPRVEADEPSSLSDWANQADYLIIAPRALSRGAQALAAYRRGQFGRVKVVWLQDIYDEFSYGRTDSGAIQAFLKQVKQRWRQVPQYVVLAGRGTLDHANRRGYGESLIPLRMAATPWGLAPSDNRYADVDGDHLPDFILGRIAVSQDAQLLSYVDKLGNYETVAPGAWATTAAVVADNPDEAGDFHANAETLSTLLENEAYNVDKLYYPEQPVGSLLRSNWASGSYGYVTYDGHGSATMMGTRSEDFLSAAAVENLDNGDYLPVFTAFSCAVGDSSYPGQLSLSDTLTLKAGGGAIAGFVPSGLSLDQSANLLSLYFGKALLGEGMSVGEAARTSLQSAEQQGVGAFMLDIYGISGDPAVEMPH